MSNINKLIVDTIKLRHQGDLVIAIGTEMSLWMTPGILDRVDKD